jgi:hypothetical protein
MMAGKLAREIRARAKPATVVAFSGRLDIETLKRLINAGCDGAAEKGVPSSWRPILTLVEKRLADMVASHRREAGPFGGVKHAAGSIRDILEDWNERPAGEGGDAQWRKSA